MDEFNYRYNWEYATKHITPISEHKNAVEIYDRYGHHMLNTSEWTVEQLVDHVWEVWGTWRRITKEEYERIINWEE